MTDKGVFGIIWVIFGGEFTFRFRLWLWLGTGCWKFIDVKKDKTGEFIEATTFTNNEKYLDRIQEIEDTRTTRE